MWTNVFFKQQLIVCVVQLISLAEAAQYLLVLFLKKMAIDMIKVLKHTAGHRGCLHTSLLKKPQTLWSSGCHFLLR